MFCYHEHLCSHLFMPEFIDLGLGFSHSSVGTDSACNAGDPGSIPGSGRSLEEGLATHSNIFAGKSHGQWNLADYSPWDRKESDMTERLTHTSLPL